MLRVLVCGNSIALHVAPHRLNRKEGTYVDLLRRQLEPVGGRVISIARQSNMIDEDMLEFMANVQRYDADAVVMHFGVNEAAPRILPRGLWMWLKGPQAYGRLKSGVRRVESIVEPGLIRLASAGGWIGPRQFGAIYDRKLEVIGREGAGTAFVVNIGPPSDTMERLLPGMGRSVDACNDVLADLCRKHDAVLVDVHDLVRRTGMDIQPDGCHFTGEGHRLVHQLLFDKLSERFPRQLAGARTVDS